MSQSLAAVPRGISCRTREGKFDIFRQPFIILFVIQADFLYSRFKKDTGCHSFMAPNKVSDVSAADWRSQIHVKLSLFVTCGDTVFLSGGNLYEALQLIQ